MEERSTADILRAAKALIDTPEKWRQGWEDYGDRLCMVTAVTHVLNGAHVPDPVWQCLGKAIRKGGGSVGPLWRWNDAPERTHAEVMEAFDKAIALAEAEAVPA